MVLGHNIYEGNRTQDIKIKEDITFDSILLNKKTLSGLKKSGFYKPSPIQLHGIPLGKCGFDLLLEAKSGTGKTAVFTVIALEKIDLAVGLQVIVLAPTREIAAQICDVTKQIGSEYSGLNVEVVMGGLPVQDDIDKFKSKEVHIVVGSPGRLKHLIQDKHIDVSAVRLLVLDECDKLVEKSFLTDINYIFSNLPKQKQVVMSSATYPENCKTFISKFVHNAQHICPDSNSVLLGISQNVTLVKQNSNIVKQTQNRFQELLKIFTAREFKQCLIFCNYQARVAELHRLLTKEKWPAKLLYGQQEQNDRLDALKTLQEFKCRILVSTDLAARGIDASNVDLVINFELPFDWQTYLHRIGRAGRYGSYGTAITILSEGQEVIKFNEVFKSMNLSLNLTYLWTGDQFKNLIQPIVEVKTDIVQPEKDKPLDVINKELWEILTSESQMNTELFETFEELQNSFKNPDLSSNENIESFSELLTSFEILDDTSTEYIPYSHINIKKIDIKGDFSCFQNDSNDIKEIEPNNYCWNSETNESDNSEKGENQQNNFTLEHLNIDNKYSADHKIIKNTSPRQTISIGDTESPSSSCDSIHFNMQQDYTKALLEAGLPTEFGKNRNKISTNKLQCPGDTKINEMGIHKKEDNFTTDYLNRDLINISSKSQQKYKRIEEATSVVGNNSNFKNTIKLDKFSRNSYATHLNTIKSNSKTMQKNIENYNIWYNQLKTCMRQLEYTIYIDEMSRLN